MKRVLVVLVVMAVFLAQTVVFAASPWTQEATYEEKAGAKLQFGLKNLVFGWTELLTTPIQGDDIFNDIGTGLVNAIAYTLGGAAHTATFLIPVDVPLPNDGVRIG